MSTYNGVDSGDPAEGGGRAPIYRDDAHRARQLRLALSYDTTGPGDSSITSADLEFLAAYGAREREAAARANVTGPFAVETLLGHSDDVDVVAARDASFDTEPSVQNF